MEAIESRFLSYWEKTKSNSIPTFTASLRARKEFTNPYILERVIDKLNIDEYGTKFSTSSTRRHTPDEYVAEDFYLVLRELSAANASVSQKSQTLELVTSVGVKEEEKDSKVHLKVGSDSRNGLILSPESQQFEPPKPLSQHWQGEEKPSTGTRLQKRSRWQ